MVGHRLVTNGTREHHALAQPETIRQALELSPLWAISDDQAANIRIQ
jgi:hypothetical protein